MMYEIAYLLNARRRRRRAAADDVVDVTAPTITSSSTVSLAENVALSHTLTADETVSWTKTGGADTALFTLVGSNLSMTAKDYEAPADANVDNAYVVQVTATDLAGNATNQTITVTVTDVAEYSAEATALFARMTAQPNATRKGLYNTLYAALKTGAVSGSNILAKLDALHVVGADQQHSCLSLVSSAADLTPTGATVFVADRYMSGDGVNGHWVWGQMFNGGGQYAQDSAHLMTWEVLAVTDNTMAIGSVTGVSSFVRGRNTTVAEGRLNTATTMSQTQTDSLGMTLANRSGPTASQIYRNAGAAATSAGASSATSLATVVAYCRNQSTYSTRRVAAGSKGSSLSSNERLDLYNALNAYLTAIGAV